MNRREIIKTLTLSSAIVAVPNIIFGKKNKNTQKPIVLSTWYNQAVAANDDAWKILNQKGRAVDAVELGVMVSENDWNNCCVGLGANPDRDGFVTLDASIMDEKGKCGSVAFLEQIANPIKVARLVLEKTPHVMLVGQGAQQFALQNGMELKSKTLSEHAKKDYENWLKKSEYKPVINIEKGIISPPQKLNDGSLNHDTIGMIAMDEYGNLSGACTTSGMAYKMRGRVGDSPIIGAGLYVDNEVGAATATGNGEEVIRVCGSFLVVEYMRQGYSPEMACKKAVERVIAKTDKKKENIQVGFIALNKHGEYGSYAIHKGFDYAVKSNVLNNQKVDSKYFEL